MTSSRDDTRKSLKPEPRSHRTRRQFLTRAAGAVGAVGAVAAASQIGAPYIGTAKAQTTTWKIQTAWPGGIGLQIFKDWCNTIVEKTGGELAWRPFGAKDVVGDFQLFDAVKNGVLQAMNPFTIYWAGRMPASVFLTSYPLGMRNPHEWDVFYYGLGGLEIARELFAKQKMHYVGPIHHGPNIIHSKVPIRSIEDFRGRKMRLPGGMVAEVFQAAGAKTIVVGSDVADDLVRRHRVVERPDPGLLQLVQLAAHTEPIDRLVARQAAHQYRDVVLAALGVGDVGEQPRRAVGRVDAAAELPAHQRVHLGVLVDLAVDLDQQPRLAQQVDMLMQIVVAALRNAGLRRFLRAGRHFLPQLP